jgi:hypothetical protein
MTWLHRIVMWTAQFHSTSISEDRTSVVIDEEAFSEAEEAFNKMFEIFALGEMSLKESSKKVRLANIHARGASLTTITI